VPVVFETNTIERLGKASQLEDADNLVEARDYYLAMLSTPLRMADRSEVERRLGQVSTKLLLTPRQMPEKKDHVVQRGESLDKIARKYGTTVELVQISNRLSNAGRIRAGDVLRVFAGKFRLEVSKSRNDLIVYLGDRFFKRYSVGTGKFGKTPEGTFEITERIKEPAWWRPDGKGVPYGDKENILGTRWMTLRATGTTPDVRGYGIHGTWQPESIGKAESAGCIRMKNEDVEEMFTLMPVGTPVTILP
jgi:lipoprotein-anchoring transpeptidase ErfK/SrfK